ncbi:disintegrin and metalloproteinase domain-containing protein 9 [Electrophorus electricus]|uniref:disintegrin and metalloproteinase domain-containing protein 9 n=1 Tax=Electrophorus electricus TaxID=8005 RepID=UPI0015D00DFE|nr:disintegrin and metalloproteinase domain-containing protein 9 [Electrophorus electricus]
MAGQGTRRTCGQFLIILAVLFRYTDAIRREGLFREQISKLKSFQIVTPQLVRDRKRRHDDVKQATNQTLHSEGLTYMIKIADTIHYISLTKNKDFLSPRFTVVSHGTNKSPMKIDTKKPASCHYNGHVEGREDSLVALSTCNGLRGVIFLGNESYGLEPAVNSSTNEHLLFPLKHVQTEPFVCGLANDISHSNDGSHEAGLSMIKFLRRKRNLPQTRYVELVLVVDNQRFIFKKRNVTAVKNEMVQLTNLVDTYYQQLNIRIILVGLEIFEAQNPFSVSGSAGAVLGNFVDWRKTNLVPRIQNDMAQLIVGQAGAYSGGILGMAFVGSVCSVSTAGGISVYSDNQLQYYSTVLAHEMGHNLGMYHDDTRCQCGTNGYCVMDSTATGSTLFSECSGNDFATLISRGGGVCLKNQPLNGSFISVAECGNGILDPEEQCDCGLPGNCTNPCCDAATCTFTRGSTCAAGSCCKNCQLLVSGTLCRSSVNECDLPEFCLGSSGFCPRDTYLMDGIQCAANTAYCYEGRCQTLDYQCKQLFGSTATKADNQCFRYINMQGTMFGNCGYSGSTLVPCSSANIMCGKIQCTNFDSNYPPAGAVISVQNIGQNISCRNANFNLGPDVMDPTYVQTGTVCDTGKVCIKFQCVNSSELTQTGTCNAGSDCHGNGVCNNLGHCFCNDGWGPPNCNVPGRGGSVDSGPAEIDYSLRNGLLIFFLLVVPLLAGLVLLLLFVFRRDMLRRCLNCHGDNTHGSNSMPQRSSQPSSNVQSASALPATVRTPPTRPQPPQFTAAPGGYASYGNWSGDDTQITVSTSPTPIQGPGVPKPIPPKQVVT